ncbi:MAG: beta-propeller fold lactonase family protein [candidate division NC10 bacterium]
MRGARARLALVVMLAVGLAVGAVAPAGAATLFVTNTRSDSISIIDTSTLEVTGTIPLGKGKPNRVAFHPDGKTAWVVYDKSHDLGVVDAETGKLVRRVKIGGNPYNLAFTPDGRTLCVLDWSSETSKDEIIFYDLAAGRIDGRVEVSTWPAHGVFSRDGKLLYVSGETAGDVTVIDMASRAIVARLVHGGGDAMGLALTADGKTLYAAAGENKTILKIDTATNTIVGEIGLPGVVHEATLTLDGAFLYTTLRGANRIVVVRTEDDTIVATIPQKGYPDLVTMEPSGRHALVTNRHADLVSVIDLETHTQVKTIPVGRAPHGMALQPR